MKRTQKNKRTLLDRLLGFLYNRLPSDKLILYILLIVFVFSGLYTLQKISRDYTVSVPNAGGTLTEGVIGTPRFVNPVLAITRADHDLVALTYSGLMRLGVDGELTEDLAEVITISEDGLVYNVTLKQNQQFHDGTTVSAEDIAFTIGLIQDPELKSPLRGDWSGVVVEVLGEHELNFVLSEAYTPFIENLMVGILPKHVWGDLTTEELPFSQHNTEPIGTGPYHVTSIKHNDSGLINEYVLTAVPSDNTPNISTVHIKFFHNEDDVYEALKSGVITSTAALDQKLTELDALPNIKIIEQPLPRVFAIYFNQNKSPALRDPAARAALNLLINRQDLVADALNGYGSPTNSPIPPGFADVSMMASSSFASSSEVAAAARKILFDGGWTETETGTWEKEIDEETVVLAITIRTANAVVFENTARYLEEAWGSLGVEVGIELFEQSDLVQAVIRPRDYQALLFGADIGRSLDLYPFWHSSEREDPGLNVALYTSITADKLLEDIRTERDIDARNQNLEAFTTEIAADMPAHFLFSPSFLYLLSTDISHTPIKRIARPSERLSNIADWHISESDVWPIFK